MNYKTKIWADTLGNFSPYAPYFYFDCGIDQLCEGDEGYIEPDSDGSEGSGIRRLRLEIFLMQIEMQELFLKNLIGFIRLVRFWDKSRNI